MWKIALAFVAFAAIALFVISKGGEHIDMGGEKHGSDSNVQAPAPAGSPASAPVK